MKAIWESVTEQIKAEIPQKNFFLWINPINPISKENGSLVLGCPNKFSLRWVTENYLGLIKDKLKQEGCGDLNLTLKVQDPSRNSAGAAATPGPRQLNLPNVPAQGRPRRRAFHRNFTFERFVVGRCNEFAYSASRVMAQSEKSDYNALMMLSNTGLGKTHLSHAVGNAILEKNPRRRVLYMTAEDFANEMILALKNNCIEEFKRKYRRECDVLLLEEVHFLSGKMKTQAELGYTLDALANDNKKIIFTSALTPKDIPRMSMDLSSRLTAGLIASIEKPDYQTRTKIIARKAVEENLNLSEQIVHLIASAIKKDVRKMESTLKCLRAKSELLNARIDVDLTKEVLSCLASSEPSITPKGIAELVCRYFKVEEAMLQSKSRKKLHAYTRNIYAYLCRRHTDKTLGEIAETINRTHSTVLYASEMVERNMRTDARLRNQVDFLSEKIKGF
jgi:chromosomal replication initiator protein